MRHDILIPQGQDFLSAWHYPPANDALTTRAGAPVVVMAHGYSLTKDCGLAEYAERFSQAGMQVVVFDYRNFGSSGGKNREVVTAKDQIEDYQAALDFVRHLPGVDENRIALWGTSFSGGLVIAVAALDGQVRAVVAQVPNLDNLATLKFLIKQNSGKRFAWLLGQVFRDVGHALTGRSPYYVRSVGPVGSRSAYESDEDWSRAQEIIGPAWTNRVAMRDFARFPMFRAIKYLPQVKCSVQFFGCEQDRLTPVAPTLEAARQIHAELHCYPTGHYGIYVEPAKSHALAMQVRFLCDELKG